MQGTLRAGGWLLAALAAGAGAQEPFALATVDVRSPAEDVQGLAAAASEGVVSGARLAQVPLLRPGEALEMVPGLIVTQHAGDGKANQYFLRGFNLDHGTDFATYVNAVPVNLPTHAHGQGYTDLNFLIPELVERIHYRKGPYHAEEGDFSSAGVARIAYARTLETAQAQVTVGERGHARTLLTGSPQAAGGRWLYGLELFHNDGPWQVREDYGKLNGVLRYSEGTREHGYSLTAMAYQGRWTSTDQVPQRALDRGLIDRYGSLDASSGGRSWRHSLSAEWARSEGGRQREASAWLLQSALDLWSNFTYCQSDYEATGTCNTGDQFMQAERRLAGGFAMSQTQLQRWGGHDVINSVGVQARQDEILPVGLYRSQARSVWKTVREDRVRQHTLGLWGQSEWHWTPWLRSIAGLRAQAYAAQVASSLAANSGQASDQMLAPKLSLVLTPSPRIEFHVNYGHGFHSNDARGTVIRVDPNDGTTAAQRVQPLVRTRGTELGLRAAPHPGWQTTLALWQLQMDSELLFVGDAGTTEPSRPSQRHGVEWTNTLALNRWLTLDADFAWSQARFTDDTSGGNHIPGAATTTANLGFAAGAHGPWSGALRLRYVGPRPLVESNDVQSADIVLLNLRVGYRVGAKTQLMLEVYNLLDRRFSDIEYWYASRLAGEGAAMDDRHLHPGEPRSVRLTLAHRF
jgi:hypothetical protein